MAETKRKEVTIKDLDCILTDQDKLELGTALAETAIAIRDKETILVAEAEAFKKTKKEIEKDIALLHVVQNRLTDAISTGKEKREVDCETVFDYDAGMVTVRRLDTDEVIEDRDMEGLERQMQMQWEEENEIEPEKAIDATTPNHEEE